eukprot:1369118-Karenia_brevis.AAC.1
MVWRRVWRGSGGGLGASWGALGRNFEHVMLFQSSLEAFWRRVWRGSGSPKAPLAMSPCHQVTMSP